MGPCTRPRISRPRRSSLWRRCGSPSQRTGSPCPSCGRSRCYATSANTTIPTLSDWSTYATDRDTIGRWSSTSCSSTSIREAPLFRRLFCSLFFLFKGDNSEVCCFFSILVGFHEVYGKSNLTDKRSFHTTITFPIEIWSKKFESNCFGRGTRFLKTE